MMKKVYVEPTIDVLEIKVEPMLQNSNTTMGVYGDENDGDGINDVGALLSRGRNVWDDDLVE